MRIVGFKNSKAFIPTPICRTAELSCSHVNSFNKGKLVWGFTLIEMMVAMAIICIAAIGVLDYQYHSVKHCRIAQTQLTASNTAQLLLEDWKSTGGSTDYNPAILQLGFTSSAVPSGFTMGQAVGGILNDSIYTVTINDVPMLVILTFSDVDHDDVSGTTLRQLTAMVRWQMGKATGSGGTTLCDSPVILTTYVRLDG
jgi:prepilin-type N-terminal cleavage/methylation domain-containing protein